MPLIKTTPNPSGRMGALWTLGTIQNAAILEFGSMGHILDCIAKTFSNPKWFLSEEQVEGDYNLIGSNCDATRFLSDAREIRRIMEGAFHKKAICTLTSQTSVEGLQKMHKAKFNLVLRKHAEKAAKSMKQKLGINYHVGAPYGYEGTMCWIRQLEEFLKEQADPSFLAKEQEETRYAVEATKMWVAYHKDQAKIKIKGEPYVEESLKAFASKELHMKLEDGGIYMMPASEYSKNLENEPFYSLTRTTKDEIINPYESPYMGFRGAMKLCALWSNNG
ncbi:MAG: nitrogenase molybdenum-cofactor synthesis protein NifE [Clostridiales bacterium]|nr:nitrogenase molybdenum-cofactor synthesis protein NifE [Clostridiales bacterium]